MSAGRELQRCLVIADHGEAGRVLVPVGASFPEDELEERQRRWTLLEQRRARLGGLGRRAVVALVGCGFRKTLTARPARELYTGSLFGAALREAEAIADVVFVVSALHGLVELDQVLEPYNVKLARHEGRMWAAAVQVELARALGEVAYRTVVYAGGVYSSALREWLPPGDREYPLEGMGLGARLGWFAARRRERDAGKSTKSKRRGILG